MEKDILGRIVQEHGGSFSADGAQVQFSGGRDGSRVGALITQLGYQYAQPVQRIYELGTRSVYFIAGRAQGNASAGSIIGPKALTYAFYQQYGNVCMADKNHLWISLTMKCDGKPPRTGTPPPSTTAYSPVADPSGGTGGTSAPGTSTEGAKDLNLKMSHVVLLAMSGSVAAEQMIIGEQLQFQFVALYDTNQPGVSGGGGGDEVDEDMFDMTAAVEELQAVFFDIETTFIQQALELALSGTPVEDIATALIDAGVDDADATSLAQAAIAALG